ncbi:hypothetical protein HDU96_006331 [Phlyctochytrium bullatum]|nr:hypothetical protein HDU96_006331 [Phlyctochytrium bullatum]
MGPVFHEKAAESDCTPSLPISFSNPEGIRKDSEHLLVVRGMTERKNSFKQEPIMENTREPVAAKFLLPEERRERMMEYDANVLRNPNNRRRLSSLDAGARPAWRPGGLMRAMDLAQIMRNRLKAKEVAERTRKSILGDEEDEEQIDLNAYDGRTFLYFSTDSIAEETQGPFSHAPEELKDSEAQKPKINYPALRMKKDKQDDPLPDEPLPQSSEEPPSVEVEETRPLTHVAVPLKERHIREVLELIVEKAPDGG